MLLLVKFLFRYIGVNRMDSLFWPVLAIPVFQCFVCMRKRNVCVCVSMFWVYVKQTVDSIGVWKRTEHWAGNIVLIPAHRCIACGWCTTQNETNRERERVKEKEYTENPMSCCVLCFLVHDTQKNSFFSLFVLLLFLFLSTVLSPFRVRVRLPQSSSSSSSSSTTTTTLLLLLCLETSRYAQVKSSLFFSKKNSGLLCCVMLSMWFVSLLLSMWFERERDETKSLYRSRWKLHNKNETNKSRFNRSEPRTRCKKITWKTCLFDDSMRIVDIYQKTKDRKIEKTHTNTRTCSNKVVTNASLLLICLWKLPRRISTNEVPIENAFEL